MPATPVWMAAAEAMLNRNIDQSSAASALAGRLESKSLQIDAESLIRVRVGVTGSRLLLTIGADDPADALIAGSPPALLRLFSAARPSPSAASAAMPNAHIRGDADVANQFRELLQYLRPDFEEELGRWVGTIPAHGIAKVASGVLGWGIRAVHTTRANIREYLQEESRALVNPIELNEYLRGVDAIREATDRAEARLRELERRTGRSA